MSKVAPIRPKGNPFAALDLSDSEQDGAAPAPGPVGTVDAAPVEVAAETPAQERPVEAEVSKPRYRVWAEPETAEPAAKVPFSKGRRSKVRHASDKEGWTSIQWNKPQFQEDSPASISPASSPRPIEEDLVEAAAGNQGTTEEMAKMWADRVKASLEKAEAAKRKKNPLSDDFIQSLSKLSFFRRAPTKSEDVAL